MRQGLCKLGSLILVSFLFLPPQVARANQGAIYAATSSGVFKSTDGGANWRAANSGLRAVGIHRLAIAPQEPVALYANVSNGLLKSTDGGTSWNRISSVTLLAIDPQDPATLFAAGRQGLEKSTDGGMNWSPAKTGLRELPEHFCPGVSSLTIDPQDTRTVYAGLWNCPGGGSRTRRGRNPLSSWR